MALPDRVPFFWADLMPAATRSLIRQPTGFAVLRLPIKSDHVPTCRLRVVMRVSRDASGAFFVLAQAWPRGFGRQAEQGGQVPRFNLMVALMCSRIEGNRTLGAERDRDRVQSGTAPKHRER